MPAVGFNVNQLTAAAQAAFQQVIAQDLQPQTAGATTEEEAPGAARGRGPRRIYAYLVQGVVADLFHEHKNQLNPALHAALLTQELAVDAATVV